MKTNLLLTATIQSRSDASSLAYTDVADWPGHDFRYAIDATKVQTEFGWHPTVTLEEGLARTVDWYLENTSWWQALLDREGVGQRLGTGKGSQAGA